MQLKKVFSLLLILTLLIPFYTQDAYATQQLQLDRSQSPSFDISGLIDSNIRGDFDFNSKRPVTVIVEIDEPSVLDALSKGKAYDKSNLDKVRKNIIAEAKAKVKDSKVKREYSHVFSGFSIELPANQIKALMAIEGVKSISQNMHYQKTEIGTARVLAADEVHASMFDSAPFINAPAAWALGIKGTGVTVAVIDTGVDYTHPDLVHAFTSGKLGYDFVDNDDDPMEYPGEYHGTHVAGTIAGYNATSGFSGIAPGAKLLAYRVLGPDGGYTEDVLAGIEQAVIDGAKVMNLSLGNTLNAPDYATSIALDAVMANNVIAVTSNGNSGSAAWTVGSPGTSRGAISVGATMQPFNSFKSNIEVSDGILYPSAVMGYSTEEQLLGINNYDYKIVFGGLGYPRELNAKKVKGNVVLIQRGELPFVDKVENAYNAGAVAVLIYDHTSGNIMPDIPGMALPTFKLSKEVGEMLKLSMDQLKKDSLNVTFNTEFDKRFGETVADFSSRGPVIDTWMIKPDVCAPGVDIVSTVPGGKYASLQGTSMSSPHIAGVAALLLQKNSTYTADEIKAIMMNASVDVDVLVVNKDGSKTVSPAPHNAQGAGSIRVDLALKAQTIVTPGSHSFGVFYPESDSIKSVILDVQNTASEDKTYHISVDFNGNDHIQTSYVSTLVVEKNSSRSLSITVDLALSELASGFYEGEVSIEEVSTVGEHVIDVPLILFVNEPNYKRITHAGLEFVDRQPWIWGYLPAGAELLQVAVFDLNYEYVGLTHYIEDIETGFFEYEWDGTADGKQISYGTYYLVFFATAKGNTTGVIGATFNTPLVKGRNK